MRLWVTFPFRLPRTDSNAGTRSVRLSTRRAQQLQLQQQQQHLQEHQHTEQQEDERVINQSAQLGEVHADCSVDEGASRRLEVRWGSGGCQVEGNSTPRAQEVVQYDSSRLENLPLRCVGASHWEEERGCEREGGRGAGEGGLPNQRLSERQCRCVVRRGIPGVWIVGADRRPKMGSM